MQRRLIKYCAKFLSLILFISMVSSGTGICGIYVAICNTQTSSSCCCNNPSEPIQLDQNCCCVIKAATAQPAEISLSFSQTLPLTHLIFVKTNHYDTDIVELNVTRSDFTSVHSPPKKDIYLINSNFRI